jgi:hypothetical protein
VYRGVPVDRHAPVGEGVSQVVTSLQGRRSTQHRQLLLLRGNTSVTFLKVGHSFEVSLYQNLVGLC